MTKQHNNPHLKMYILVRKRAPIGVAAVNAAHVALMAFDKFKQDKDMKRWFKPGPFYKVLVAVTDVEWKRAKRVRDHVLIREDMWGDREVAMAFKPRLKWPKTFGEFPFFPAKPKRKKRRTSKTVIRTLSEREADDFSGVPRTGFIGGINGCRD